MSNCADCRHCSWPKLVARARADLPDPWRTELLRIEKEEKSIVPEAIWVAALLKCESGSLNASALDAIIGEIDVADFSWADSALCRSHPETNIGHADHS